VGARLLVSRHAVGDRRQREVTIGDHAHGSVVLGDHDRPDVAVAHELADMLEGVAGVCGHHVLRHDVSDQHGATVSPRGLSADHYHAMHVL